MKLATYQDGSRDGQLVVVSRDLTQAHYATHIANRLQHVLDDWNYLSPQLEDVYVSLNQGRARHAFPFDPAQCMAPLPRAYQRVGAFAYPQHVELLAQAAAQGDPAATELQMRQLASDDLAGPQSDLLCTSTALGLDFEAGLAALTSDVPQGCASDRALDALRLLVLVNDVTLRSLAAIEAAKGWGALHSKPAAAFGPVAVTPDELGDAWARGRVHLPLQCNWNGRKVGLCDAGADMAFHFGQLIAHAAATRRLRAGSIVGTGPVSNKGVVRKSRTDWPLGYSCIAEKRAMETVQDGQPSTDYLQYGDTIRLEMKGRDGVSVFGAIHQEVVPTETRARAAAQAPAVSAAPVPDPSLSDNSESTV